MFRAVLACLLMLACPAAAQTLTAASDGRHLWAAVAPKEGSPVVIWHRASGDAPHMLNKATKELRGKLSGAGLAADYNKLWLVYRDNSVQVLRAVASETPSPWHYSSGIGRSLPADTRLRALAADSAGPWALVNVATQQALDAIDQPLNEVQPPPEPAEPTPEQVEQNLSIDFPPGLVMEDVSPAPQTEAKDDEAKTPVEVEGDVVADRLLRMTWRGWQMIPLPQDWPANAPRSALLVDPQRSPRPLLLAQTGEESPRRTLLVYTWSDEAGWQRSDYELHNSRRWEVALIDGQLALAQQGDKATVELSILRRGSVIRIGQWTDIAAGVSWSLLAIGDLALLLDNSPVDAQPPLRWSMMDLGGQLVSEPTVLKPDQQAARGRTMQTVTVAVVVMSLLLLLVLWQREPQGAQINLDEQTQVAAMWRRAVAGLIDLGVPAFVVMTYFDLDPVQLRQRWPGVQADPAHILPAVCVMALFLFHVTLTELLTATSLGKRLMGLRVCRRDGTRPTAWQLLIRNLLKAFDLITPWLLVLPLLSPTRERLGDLAAKTLVVMKKKMSDG
ncbi:MAG: RDD family protein [Phycisphaeraceae bacterium]|nr:RDD family protein [Phycisphaeraceae bacterium]